MVALSEKDMLASEPSKKDKLTPEQANRIILGSLYRVKIGSRLQHYIDIKTQQDQRTFILAKLLVALKAIILIEGLFDKRNPSIIICDSELERTFGLPAMHTDQLQRVVMNHLDVVEIIVDGTITREGLLLESMAGGSDPTRPFKVPGAQDSIKASCDDTTQYRLRPKFLKVIQIAANCEQVTFTLSQVDSYLSKYILDNGYRLVDPRNLMICKCQNDILGEAFECDYFYRNQTVSFIEKQLIPESKVQGG